MSSIGGSVTTLGGEAAISSFRTTRQIYRDLMRLTRHAGQYNQNEIALQHSIRAQFKANMLETDDEQIKRLKSQAIRALSNYYVYQAKLMVGNQAPKSIYDEDGDDDEEEDTAGPRAAFGRPQQHAELVADAEVREPPRKRLTAADRRRNMLRTRQLLKEKQRSVMDGFAAFASRYKEALQRQQGEEDQGQTAGGKEAGGVV